MFGVETVAETMKGTNIRNLVCFTLSQATKALGRVEV